MRFRAWRNRNRDRLHHNEDQHIPVTVINKHVVRGATKDKFLMTLQIADDTPNVGQDQTFELSSFERRWFPHPDPEVNLCVLPITQLVREAAKIEKRLFFVPLDSSLIPTPADLDSTVELEAIVMVGHPNGLWDSTNNLPIFRKGVHVIDYKRHWNGKNEFLINSACFPGLSGSPVMLFEIGSY